MKLAKWNDRGANVMRMNIQGLAGRVKIPGFMTLCLTFSENELILGIIDSGADMENGCSVI